MNYFLYDFGIINFSFKNTFSVLFFRNKKGTRVFQCQGNHCNHYSFLSEPCLNFVDFFWSFNLELRFLGKCTWCPWNQPHFLTKSNKSPYLLCKKKGNLRQFCRWTTAEGDNVKINLSSNIPLSFCSSKFVHFFKISFREKRVFKSCTIKWMECK